MEATLATVEADSRTALSQARSASAVADAASEKADSGGTGEYNMDTVVGVLSGVSSGLSDLEDRVEVIEGGSSGNGRVIDERGIDLGLEVQRLQLGLSNLCTELRINTDINVVC